MSESEADKASEPQANADGQALGGRSSFFEIFGIFLRLGLTSFGGPVAHIGYFREAFVERRRWLSDSAYADIVALCQFMPGPASSQVGFALGLMRGGGFGALAAWAGFTLPSAALLILFAYGLDAMGEAASGGWLQGLKALAVAVVAQAVWGMAKNLTPDALRASLAVLAAGSALLVPGVVGQLGGIAVGAMAGFLLLRGEAQEAAAPLPVPVPRGVAIVSLLLFFVLLFGLPVLAASSDNQILALVDSFYRAGALVFGGGHVVLPLLEAEVVEPGWVETDAFIAGYGAAQAVPGPLFTFAAFLGAASGPEPNGWLGGLICLAAIFLSTPLLVVGLLPFWQSLRTWPLARAALLGVNAAVVGLLLAALYDPVFVRGVQGAPDLLLAMAAFVALALWRVPVLLVVLGAAVAGAGIAAVS